ncbi:MAG: hypothetical protein V3T81_08200, partial [Thermoanaerobaculia bacterium]
MEAESLNRPSLSPQQAENKPRRTPAPGGLFRRPRKPLKPRQVVSEEFPQRYAIRENDEGRFITCLEAPEVKVRVDRTFSVTSAAARRYPNGTIFLDGAAQGEPFLDLERQIYNLDHHEGCVRPFTLASCEQALVLVLRGLDLRERPWTIYANEPDLDTVLAIWVLLNSTHLREADQAIRRAVVPMVRLEGLVDSHGLEFLEFSGYPEDYLDEVFQRLERLRAEEKELKNGDRWGESDALEYTASLLQRLDGEVYPVGFFEAFRGIEELAKCELTNNRIAVVCRAECGIYELEKDLKRLYGKRLGVIILQKTPKSYTLRQVDPFLPVNLEAAYRKLNVLDPAVESGVSANRWGGSAEIGGSPRLKGTALGPVDIAEACRLAYRRPTFLERLGSVGMAVFYSGLTMLAGWLAVIWGRFEPSAAVELFDRHRAEFVLAALAVSLLVLLGLVGRRRRRVFGLQLPEGRGWMFMALPVMLAALSGGVWVFPVRGPAGGWPPALGADPILVLLAFPVLAEVLFRGVVHGLLVRNFSIQYSSGRWFLSWPVALSAILYAVWTLPFWFYLASPVTAAWPIWPTVA